MEVKIEELLLTINKSSKKISTTEWKKKCNDVQISKSDLNKLVMNYLVIEGYKEAAEKFQEESGTLPEVDLNSISNRMAIRNAIQSGNIEKGIEKVNDLDPQILDSNPQLFFHLQQQTFIELVKQGKINEALVFAQEELSAQAQENSIFIEELEKTLSLLCFEDFSKCPNQHLVQNSQRQKTASELNAAILQAQNQEKDPKLPTLLKMLKWSQTKLEEKTQFPKVNDILNPETPNEE